MTAAFQATYADWKLIKTRSCVQIVFEVPLHDANAAYQCLGGMPDIAKERWVAIARLQLREAPTNSNQTNDRLEQRPASVSEQPARGFNIIKTMGRLRNDSSFQLYMNKKHGCARNPDAIAAKQHELLGVPSLANIEIGSAADTDAHALYLDYKLWMNEPAYVEES